MTERDIKRDIKLINERANFYRILSNRCEKRLMIYADKIHNYRKTLRQQNKGIRRLRKKLNYYKEELKSRERTYSWNNKALLERIEVLEKSGNGKRIKELERLVEEYHNENMRLSLGLNSLKITLNERETDIKVLSIRNIELCKAKNTMEKEIENLLKRNAILEKQIEIYERNENK